MKQIYLVDPNLQFKRTLIYLSLLHQIGTDCNNISTYK